MLPLIVEGGRERVTASLNSFETVDGVEMVSGRRHCAVAVAVAVAGGSQGMEWDVAGFGVEVV